MRELNLYASGAFIHLVSKWCTQQGYDEFETLNTKQIFAAKRKTENDTQKTVHLGVGALPTATCNIAVLNRLRWQKAQV
jgi:hypothetical protein